MKHFARQIHKHEMDCAPYSCVELIASTNLEVHCKLEIEGNDHWLHTDHSIMYVSWEKVLEQVPPKILKEHINRLFSIYHTTTKQS